MKLINNFERAIKLTDNWPSWKRNYQLTKDSEVRQNSRISEEKNVALNKQISMNTSHKIECEV
ncbi:hypothetical protein BH10PSE16_BH10PSE16_28840 [soil metagenome]